MTRHASQVRANVDSTSWLSQLKEAHADLLSAIEHLERLTRGTVPTERVLVRTRWEVSKASLARRQLWGRIHAHLSAVVDQDGATQLRYLQDIEIRLMRATTRHIARWTNEAVLKDWSGYRLASAEMRSKLTDAIGGEKRILYPILERFAGDSAGVR